jgi:hypothetical protein
MQLAGHVSRQSASGVAKESTVDVALQREPAGFMLCFTHEVVSLKL